MTETRESAIEFPCDFPIKVVGKAAQDFDTLVVEIVRRHVADLTEESVSVRASRGGNYVAMTVTVRAHSQQQLDALYTELSGHERVVMVL
jgi:hypothetical protein